MKPQPRSSPRATIVMAARERHALAESAIDSIVSATKRPYRFIYLDVQSPDWLREILARRSAEWGLEVIRFDEPLWAHEARGRVVDAVDTDYVVFIDNDVRVDEDWLGVLVACADETGAGIVGPLYLWGDGIRPPMIHMAGGDLSQVVTEYGRVLIDRHIMVNADPMQVKDALRRGPCGFLEYHCMLIRTDLLRDGTLLDTNLRCIHENIDTALSVKRRGFQIFFEPSARVTYLAFAPYMLEDLPFFRQRWSSLEAAANIDVFCRKWNVVDDGRSFESIRRFVREHVAEVDPIRASPNGPKDRHTPMRRDELRQTRSDLLDFAIEQGYGTKALALVANSYRLAQILMDGVYRPCGRPFTNHLAGTASVLIRYGFRAETVAAGLLHSAYSHGRTHPEGPDFTMRDIQVALGAQGSEVERRVRAYTERESSWADLPAGASSRSTLSVLDGEIMAIAAANEVDMHLSGEFRYSGRTDAIKPHVVRQIAQVCEVLGVSGLSDTLAQAEQSERAARPELVTNIRSSYRIARAERKQ
jgi:GT2 family glycosyltransferase